MKKIALVVASLVTVFVIGCSKYESGNDTATQDVYGTESVEYLCPEGDDEDPLPTLRGTVTDSVSQDSLQGACVNLFTSTDTFVASIGTDDNGHYYFNSVADGSYKLVFSKTNYITKTIPITVASNNLAVDAGLIFAP